MSSHITTDISSCKICKNCGHSISVYFGGLICCLSGDMKHIVNPCHPACKNFEPKGDSNE